MYKTLFVAGPLAIGGLVYAGAIPVELFQGAAYSQTVPATPDQVAAAVSDLEFSEFGNLNTVARGTSLTGRRTEEGYVWTLGLGNKQLVHMTAKFKPVQDGAATYVSAKATPGPDQQMEGAPRGAKDINTMNSIFAAALEEEMNGLFPEGERLSDAEARKRRKDKMITAVAMHTMTHTNEIVADMEAAAARMKKDDAASERRRDQYIAEQRAQANGVTFKPGQPMVDVRR
jgi:hypothetical protein